MKKRFSLILIIIMLFSSISVYGNYYDISGHWAEATMKDWVNKGFISGYGDGSLRPDNPVTRAEFFSLVNRAFGYTNKVNINFSDVDSSKWYYNTISVAVAAGYVNGYPNNTIEPERNITREEVAVIISIIAYVTPYEMGADIYSDIGGNDWSKPYIGGVSNAGIMSGYPDGTFRPKGNLSRAEAVTALNFGLIRKNQSIGYIPPIESQTRPDGGLVDITPNTGDSNIHIDGDWTIPNEYKVIIKKSSFGSSSDEKTVNGDILIDINSTTIRNVDINGNLYIPKGVRGNINIYDTQINGNIYIEGTPKLLISSSDVGDIGVRSNAQGTRITARRDSGIGNIYLRAGAIIEDITEYGNAFNDIILENEMRRNSEVELDGDFSLIDIYNPRAKLSHYSGKIDEINIYDEGERANINLYSSSTVETVDIYAKGVSFEGKGRIKDAYLYNKGTYFEVLPDEVHGDYDYDHGSGSIGDNRNKLSIKVIDENDREPIYDARVTISGDSYEKIDYTNSSGSLDVYNLRNRRYTITVEKNGFIMDSKTIYLDDYYNDIRFVLKKDSSGISGSRFIFTIYEKDGEEIKPSRNAKITISAGGKDYTKNTSENGLAIFEGLSLGKYTYKVNKDKFTEKSGSITVQTVDERNEESVELIKIEEK